MLFVCVVGFVGCCVWFLYVVFVWVFCRVVGCVMECKDVVAGEYRVVLGGVGAGVVVHLVLAGALVDRDVG